MEVILADHAGACDGVKRALDLAYEAAGASTGAQTLGPLIHNSGVVKELEEKGIGVASTLDDISADTVIIRSHGVTPEVLDALNEKGCHIIDATCPHVLRAQKAALDLSERGNWVLVLGEKGHPEVDGLKAWAACGGGKVSVVSSIDELPDNLAEPIGIVVQTTQTEELLESITQELANRGLHFELHNTICSATSKRQNAVIELAQNVDAMVVIGGKNSSNTTRLFELCQKYCHLVFHIESIDELDKSSFLDVKTVGIAAGASTPDPQIASVVDCLRTY